MKYFAYPASFLGGRIYEWHHLAIKCGTEQSASEDVSLKRKINFYIHNVTTCSLYLNI